MQPPPPPMHCSGNHLSSVKLCHCLSFVRVSGEPKRLAVPSLSPAQTLRNAHLQLPMPTSPTFLRRQRALAALALLPPSVREARRPRPSFLRTPHPLLRWSLGRRRGLGDSHPDPSTVAGAGRLPAGKIHRPSRPGQGQMKHLPRLRRPFAGWAASALPGPRSPTPPPPEEV